MNLFNQLGLWGRRWSMIGILERHTKSRWWILQTPVLWGCLLCGMTVEIHCACGAEGVLDMEDTLDTVDTRGTEGVAVQMNENSAEKPAEDSSENLSEKSAGNSAENSSPELVDYFTQFVALDTEQQGKPASNGFGDLCAALGPVCLGQKDLAEQVAWEDFPTDPRSREWYHETWVPLCERFQLDPTARPEFLEYRDLAEFLAENQQQVEGETEGTKEETIERETERRYPTSYADAWDSTRPERFANAPWTEAEYPQVAAWLAETSPLLDLWTRAIEKPYFTPYAYAQRIPLVVVEYPDFSVFRSLATSMQIRINAAIAKDEPAAKEAAIQDVLTLFRLARFHLQRQSMIMWRLRAYDLEGRAEQSLRLLVLRGNLTSEQLETLAEQMQALPPIAPIESALHGEELILLDLIQRMLFYGKEDGLSSEERAILCMERITDAEKELGEGMQSFPFDLTKIRNFIHLRFEALRAVAAEPDSQKRYKTLNRLTQQYGDKSKMLNTAKVVQLILSSQNRRAEKLTDCLIAIGMPAIDFFLKTHERMQSQENLVTLGIALERYQRLYGDYPPSLAALVDAKLLTEIPLDPCSGLPYAYRPESFEPQPLAPPDMIGSSILHHNRQKSPYLLYSIGRDRVDQTRTFRTYYNDDLRF